jgi:hypothetical protein
MAAMCGLLVNRHQLTVNERLDVLLQPVGASWSSPVQAKLDLQQPTPAAAAGPTYFHASQPQQWQRVAGAPQLLHMYNTGHTR